MIKLLFQGPSNQEWLNGITLCFVTCMTRTEQTLLQHLWWKTFREDVQKQSSTCDLCQRTKITYNIYGTLPEKEAEAEPWEKLFVDIVGPYTIKRLGSESLTLWCVTMIDPAPRWFKMKEAKNKEVFTVATAVELTWLNLYPWPTENIFDRDSEFLGDLATMLSIYYG
jgi:Integrase zinc binding domain